ncbi:outer membrane lipoprotein-sorting protein [Chromobacterium sphagni]|uniref:Uncharacterized protein TP-0789 domain-containing protein n=1 Tax=Chromobacterium sphagni TaxID=1903179 RepID=A0ABX3CHX0_9NEIS|nr:outer membrane lipoprotein-sorting protein [Chromobacterium sphagni]OHX21940.1 hypothetical protein BI344_05425 [Chromobacterium sphagni]
MNAIYRACSLLALLAPLQALAADAGPLMHESDKRLKAPDETIQYDMELYDGGKLTTSRKLVRLDKQMADRNSTVVRFSSPVAVKNVALLIEDSGAAINDIWSYTPSTKTLRRIAGSQKQNWFMGTEFTYEDFEDYKLNAYRFDLSGSQSPCLQWAKCAVVDATPQASAEQQASGYAKKRYYIEANSYYPVQIEYFDRHGALVKRLTTEGLKHYGQYYRPTSQTMWNLANGRKTKMIVSDVSIKTGLADNLFTPRYLRNENE